MIDSIINFLHLLATTVWIGGALFIHLILQPSMTLIDPQQAGRLFGAIAKRFSIAAWSSLLVLLFTGYYKTPPEMFFDPSSDTGLILVIKHIFIIAVIIVGLFIGGVVVPRLRAATPNAGEKPSDEFLAYQKRLKTLSTTNTIFALLILLCASMLW